MSSIEQDKVHLCNLCGKQSSDYKSFKTFLEHSCKGVTFTCQDCNYPFATKKSLQVHVLSIYKKKTFPCDICNKDFSNIANLSRHERVHKNIQNHCCARYARRNSPEEINAESMNLIVKLIRLKS